MATVNTNDLRVKNAKNLIDSFNGALNEAQAYLFIGRSTGWPDDNAPPTPDNSWREFYTTYDNMLSLKRVNDIDAFHMIPRVTWTSGIVFDIYKQNYNSVNKAYSGANNLLDAMFYTINQNNDVYVCLDNNSNAQSTVEPQNTGLVPFYTSDGYQWLRVYNVSSGEMLDHTTTNFIPITNTEVVSTTDGAIFTAIIDVPGAGYTTVPAGAANQIPFYYANIDGDGTGAVAKVYVSAGSITKIEIVRSGSGYTFGEIDFSANNVYENLPDLDAGTNGLNPEGDDTFRSTVIIPPPGGWGTDLVRELGGVRVGIFSHLNYNQFDFISNCTFRQIGLIQDPVVSGTNPDTLAAYYGVNVTELTTDNYIIGEEITQVITGAGFTGGTAKGTVVGWDSTTKILRYTQGQSNVDTDGNLYRFSGVGTITGTSSGKVTTPTTYTGTMADLTFVSGYSQPEITKYSGLMTYLSNISPVTRDPAQSERISLLITY